MDRDANLNKAVAKDFLMENRFKPQKPKAVIQAEWALGAWTAWLCLFGLYQTWIILPSLQTMMAEQFQGAFTIETDTIITMAVTGYALTAFTLVWLIYKIDQGKNWARVSVLISFVFQLIASAVSPYQSVVDILPLVPDLGLQILALYLLYTWPGRTWFTREEWAADLRT